MHHLSSIIAKNHKLRNWNYGNKFKPNASNPVYKKWKWRAD